MTHVGTLNRDLINHSSYGPYFSRWIKFSTIYNYIWWLILLQTKNIDTLIFFLPLSLNLIRGLLFIATFFSLVGPLLTQTDIFQFFLPLSLFFFSNLVVVSHVSSFLVDSILTPSGNIIFALPFCMSNLHPISFKNLGWYWILLCLF